MSKIKYLEPIKGSNNLEYFQQLINSLEITTDTITYLGRTKRLIGKLNDYYSPILNDNKWNSDLRRGWETYVKNRWITVTDFNKWCAKNKTIVEPPSFNFSFSKYGSKFNLYFMKNGLYLDCYAKDNSQNFQLEYLTSSNSRDFYDHCISYIRNCSGELQKDTQYIIRDSLLIDSLKYDISNQINRITKIEHCSNNPKVPCFTFIPLLRTRKIKEGDISAWLLFDGQFATKSERWLFRAWLYALYCAKNTGRQMAYIEGQGNVGKSTVLTTITEDFMSFNIKSVKALPSEEKRHDLFSLNDFQYCRLLTLADPPPNYSIFDRQDIFNITGRDYTSIRSAFKNPITARLQAKVLIISNHPPIYDKSRSEQRTRMLHLKMCPKNISVAKEIIKKRKINNQLDAMLKEQLHMYVAYCKKAYEYLIGEDGLLYDRFNNNT